MRNRFVVDRRLGLDFLGQRADAGAQDDSHAGLAFPLTANGGRRFLDPCVQVEHG